MYFLAGLSLIISTMSAVAGGIDPGCSPWPERGQSRIDDPLSRSYNRIVDESKIDHRDWKHAERLFGVEVYRLGVVVEHNLAAEPGLGSCIFLHIWKDPVTSTSGCTAMSERELIRVISWLDPAKDPLLVQLPRPVYQMIEAEWKLPRSARF